MLLALSHLRLDLGQVVNLAQSRFGVIAESFALQRDILQALVTAPCCIGQRKFKSA